MSLRLVTPVSSSSEDGVCLAYHTGSFHCGGGLSAPAHRSFLPAVPPCSGRGVSGARAPRDTTITQPDTPEKSLHSGSSVATEISIADCFTSQPDQSTRGTLLRVAFTCGYTRRPSSDFSRGNERNSSGFRGRVGGAPSWCVCVCVGARACACVFCQAALWDVDVGVGACCERVGWDW